MKIIEAIPATKIPLGRAQIYTYYTDLLLKKGSLVLVPLGRRKVLAVVTRVKDLEKHKQEIRKAGFKLKNISACISPEPILTDIQLKLAQWLAQYYWVSLGLIIKTILPKIPKRTAKSQDFSPSSQKQTIILVPEISFISQAIKNYAPSIPEKEIAVYHRELVTTKHYQTWQKIKSGQAKIIIGPRSAIFTPVKNLEKIIITSEHDPGYKSTDQAPRYDARKVAQKLSQLSKSKLVFQSSVPSVKSYYWSTKDKYQLKITPLSFPSSFSIVDMREEITKGNYSIFSGLLNKKIEKILDKKGQAILFINRRGASTFIICRDCGYVVKCPQCEVPLVYHILNSNSKEDKLICHHCNYRQKPPNVCPQCQSHRIKYFGTGTQKVELETKKRFSQARVTRLDSDLSPKAKEKIIEDWKNKKTNLLVGTQIITRIPELAKTDLLAVISADTILHLPDFKSSERTYQLIRQLVSLTDRAVIQTYNPENPAFQAVKKQNSKSFYQKEIEFRKALSYPPFSQLIKLTYFHINSARAEREAKKLIRVLSAVKPQSDFLILGPAPGFIPRLRGRYRWQIILKLTSRNLEIKDKLLKLVPSDWTIDVDPESLL